jgi:hypothetical protein
MRRIPRRGLQRQANRLGDLVIADPARRAGARLVEEAINPALGEPSPPFANRVGGCVDAQADVLVLRPFRGQKDDAGPLRQPLRRLSPRRQTLKLTPLPLRQIDRYRRLPHRQVSAESIRKENRTYLPIRTLARFAFGWSRFGSLSVVGRDVGPVDPFGFSWPLAVSLRKPPLMTVGFPWILSSGSRLFNGLRSLRRRKFFLPLFPSRSKRRDGS